MTRAEAMRAVGGLVMSRDAGDKLIDSVPKEHGPYTLLRVTKGGLAMLAGREHDRVPLRLLRALSDEENREVSRCRARLQELLFP